MNILLAGKFVALPWLVRMACLTWATTTSAQQCTMDWISVTPSGAGASGYSVRSDISSDGTIVAFGSDAPNLVVGDDNQLPDIFIRDRTTGNTVLASITTAGLPANGGNGMPAISADGRYVAFRSWATNFDAADTDPKPDIYRHDRLTGETVLVSHRLVPGTHPEGTYLAPSVSDDGRYVAFNCFDYNLVPGDFNNFTLDVYVRDMQLGVTELVSVGNQGELGDRHSDEASISWDGRFVAFASMATNWFPGLPNSKAHVYVRDRVLGTTALVSYSPSGSYGPIGRAFAPSISGDGTRIAFNYHGPDIMPDIYAHTFAPVQAFVRDLLTGELTYVGYTLAGGLSNHESRYPRLNYDGRFVVWEGFSEDLVVQPTAGAGDVYLRDLHTGVTTWVSSGMGGAESTGGSFDARVSADGSTIVFASQASNLVPGDSGFNLDIFVRECDVASPTVYCSAKTSASGCKPAMGFVGTPSASAGSGFLLCADQLVPAQPALLLYSPRPAYTHALGTGVLCLAWPAKRTPVLDSGGGFAPCDGSIDFDMNAWIASGVDPSLQAGLPACAQVWCRDPADPYGGTLSDAVAFLIAP